MTPQLIILGGLCAALALLCLVYFLKSGRYRDQLNSLADEVDDVAAHSSFGKRIPEQPGKPEYNRLGELINTLFDTLHAKDEQSRQREKLFRDLADTMPEVILVHNEKILFANREAGELLGISRQAVNRRINRGRKD